MTDNAFSAPSHRDQIRFARAAFVRDELKAERWSIRAAAMAIGTNHTSLGARVKGDTAFLAEDIESIAYLLKRDPIEFYGEYINAGTDPSNPRTLVPKVVGSGQGAYEIASVAQGIEHWFPVPVAAGSNPAGGTLINFPTRESVAVERENVAPVTPITRRRAV